MHSSAGCSTPSSLPRPLFREEPKVLSTKKERTTPRFRPPRPPAKTCPPISRIFKRRPDYISSAAQAISFTESPDGTLTGTQLPKSKVYDTDKKVSYFEQAFHIEKKIGAGYFGNVYKVKSKEDGKFYAVKVAQETYRGHTDRQNKLEEVRKHQFLLPHRNCVHFYQSWEENGRLHLLFELCTISLDELSETKHDLEESLIWAYLVDLLLALKHLHDHNLIHMDIKPENIFIGRDGICKLGDFGLVIDLSSGENANGFAATGGDAKYMAAEVLDGRITKAADVFSLGLTILELACDLDLPTGGDLWQGLRNSGPGPECTRHLSAELRRVIQLMMIKDYGRRPTVQQILAIPSVVEARKKRENQLWWNEKHAEVRKYLAPALTFFWYFIITFVVTPAGKLFSKIATTTIGNKLGFVTGGKAEGSSSSADGAETANGEDDEKVTPNRLVADAPLIPPLPNLRLSFSSDDDDNLLLHNMSNGSTLAHPLSGDDSPCKKDDDEDPSDHLSPIKSPPTPPFLKGRKLSRSARHAPNLTTMSTPTGMRYRSRVSNTRRPLISSPQKRLDFDDLDRSSPDPGAHLSSNPETNVDRDSDVEEAIGSAIIKPVSLASKFDCYSDDNSDRE